MSSILWLVVGLGVGALILVGTARVLMPASAGAGAHEPLPSTPLQRASRWSLGLSLLPAAAAVALLAVVGVESAYASGLRVGLSLLAVASLLAAGGGAWWVSRRSRGTGALLDERDRAILERAPVVQSLATVLALAAWTVILTERFRGSGGVPLAYIQLVFWSCVLVNLWALPVGVLIGYRKG
jgi:hypothetical protein